MSRKQCVVTLKKKNHKVTIRAFGKIHFVYDKERGLTTLDSPECQYLMTLYMMNGFDLVG